MHHPQQRSGNTDLICQHPLPFYLKHEHASHVEHSTRIRGTLEKGELRTVSFILDAQRPSSPVGSILPTVLLTYVAPNARAWAQQVCFGRGNVVGVIEVLTSR